MPAKNKDGKKISKIIKKYRVEIFFFILLIVMSSVNIFYITSVFDNSAKEEIKVIRKPEEDNDNKAFIYVDVSGSVVNPGLYKVRKGARIKEVVDLAGGLSSSADKSFFFRNFNLAYPVVNNQKIYIPSRWEIKRGIIKEPVRIFDFTGYKDSERVLGTGDGTDAATKRISINNASSKELESLPGIGEKTAQRIIENRPYTSLEELLNKKILRKSVYDEIKDKLSL